MRSNGWVKVLAFLGVALVGCGPVWGLTGPFPLGVASGDVTPDSALVWARYDGTLPLRLEVWEGPPEPVGPSVFSLDVVPEESGFVHARVTGLAPGTVYQYAFFELRGEEVSNRSRVGRFRTAIAPGSLERLTLGATSCTANGRPMSVLERASQREDLDAFLFLGDTVYADSAKTLEGYRGKWEQNLSTSGYRALRASTSVVMTWDDHEFLNDWNPETIAPAVRDTARRVFFENNPVTRSTEHPDRLWRSFRWGATAEIFVLDCRTERKPSTRLTEAGEYISREQMEWLKAGLLASPAAFKLIMNSVPIAEFGGLYELNVGDRWEGYPAQRQEILSFIDEHHLRGVIWVSGDFHTAAAGRPSLSGPGSRALEVLVGPGAQLESPLEKSLSPPQWDFDSATNNFTVFQLDPITGQARVTHLDADGYAFADRVYLP